MNWVYGRVFKKGDEVKKMKEKDFQRVWIVKKWSKMNENIKNNENMIDLDLLRKGNRIKVTYRVSLRELKICNYEELSPG